jgi:hypothetical protein
MVRRPIVPVPPVPVTAAGPIPLVIKLVAGDGRQHVAENVVQLLAGDRRSGSVAFAGGWDVVISTDTCRPVT